MWGRCTYTCMYVYVGALHGLLTMLQAAPQKIWNPAIPDWRTWSKFGEHRKQGKHWEHGKNGRNQPNDLKHLMYVWFKTSPYLLRKKTVFINQITQSTLFYGIFLRRLKIIICMLGEHESGAYQNWRISSDCCALYNQENNLNWKPKMGDR